jgi:heme-degrading monooxygenase HmoA
MFARTSSWKGSPEALERWAEQAENVVLPFVRGLDGNLGAFFLVDRAGQKALTLTLWQSEEAAQASDVAADQSRARTIEATGIELLERGRYDVAASV